MKKTAQIITILLYLLFWGCEDEKGGGVEVDFWEGRGIKYVDDQYWTTGVTYKIVNNSDKDVQGWDVGFRIYMDSGNTIYATDDQDDIVSSNKTSSQYSAGFKYHVDDDVKKIRLDYFDY